jgi:predicted alpha/beta-hydrolase family hydrolase
MNSEKKNLIVLFPGAGYTVKSPLLYYAEMKYYLKGYESIKINYGNCIHEDVSWDEKIENINKYVLGQICNINYSSYDDVIFVSKSLGTIIAGWLAKNLKTNIRHIYLTPLNKTLQYIKKRDNIHLVIAGTKDDFMDTAILMAHCKREEIKLELIENADHSLEVIDNVGANIDILKRVVELY